MYAETGGFLPYFQNFNPEAQQLEDYWKFQNSGSPMNVPTSTSLIYEYDLGVEGDLFKAPEPMMEDQIFTVDPISSMMAMISCSDTIIGPAVPSLADIGSIRNDEQLLDEVFYSCEKDLMAKAVIEESPLSGLNEKMSTMVTDDDHTIQEDDKAVVDSSLQKTESLSNLSSIEPVNSAALLKPSFLDFPPIDIRNAYGMRRAFSEGDIKTLGNGGNASFLLPAFDRIIGSYSSEDRKEKLSRYRNKRTRRNFGRKIKYACRKALADSQPRIRGRFAKTDESDVSKEAIITLETSNFKQNLGMM